MIADEDQDADADEKPGETDVLGEHIGSPQPGPACRKGSSACRQEVIYQRALSIEMKMQGLEFSREHEMQLSYKGHDIGTRRVDFFIEEKIMVEIKAVINLEDVHLAQAMNYVEAYNLEIGLLINFGAKSLQHKRVHNNPRIKES